MPWRNLERAVDRLERRTFGETVRLTPMKGAATDTSRTVWTGRAILHTGGDDSIAVGDGAGGGVMRSRLMAGQAELFLTRDEYDGPLVKQGDVVRAMDREGKPAWTVAGSSDRYSNLLVLSLTQT
jgi:hypothetical protein